MSGAERCSPPPIGAGVASLVRREARTAKRRAGSLATIPLRADVRG